LIGRFKHRGRSAQAEHRRDWLAPMKTLTGAIRR
jgi:hypothetical protein